MHAHVGEPKKSVELQQKPQLKSSSRYFSHMHFFSSSFIVCLVCALCLYYPLTVQRTTTCVQNARVCRTRGQGRGEAGRAGVCGGVGWRASRAVHTRVNYLETESISGAVYESEPHL